MTLSMPKGATAVAVVEQCIHTVLIEDGVAGGWEYIRGTEVDGGPAGGPCVKNCR